MDNKGLITAFDRIVCEGFYDDAKILGVLCDLVGVAIRDGEFQVHSQVGRERFRTLAQQMLRMVPASVDDIAGDLNDLINLMVLQEVYMGGDPRFTQALEQYYTPKLEAYNAEIADLQKKWDLLNTKLREAETEKQETVEKLSEKKEELIKIEEQAQKLSATIDNLDAKVAELEQNLLEVTAERDDLRRQLTQASESQKSGEEEIVAYLYWDDQYIHGCAAPLSTHDWNALTPADKRQLHQLCIEPVTPFAAVQNGMPNRYVKGTILSLYSINNFPNLHTVTISGLSPFSLKLQGAFRNCPRISTLILDCQDCDLSQVSLESLRNIRIFAKPGGKIEEYARRNALTFVAYDF